MKYYSEKQRGKLHNLMLKLALRKALKRKRRFRALRKNSVRQAEYQIGVNVLGQPVYAIHTICETPSKYQKSGIQVINQILTSYEQTTTNFQSH